MPRSKEREYDGSTKLDNAKHEAFARRMLEITEGQTQGEVYAKIYGQDDSIIASNSASRLLANERIQARIDYLRLLREQSLEMQRNFNVDLVRGWFTDLFIEARAKGDLTNANRTAENAARILGIYKDGITIEDKRERPVKDYSGLTFEELQAERDELLRRDN